MQRISLDQVSPDSVILGGASSYPKGLPAGPSELCYSFQFRLLAGGAADTASVCVFCGDLSDWPFMFIDTASGPNAYTPTFCGQSEEEALPVCFPLAAPPPRPCGDASGDLITNITDVVYLINYIFNGWLPPNPVEAGDANCDGVTNITDAVYLIAYIFSEGPEPCGDCMSGILREQGQVLPRPPGERQK